MQENPHHEMKRELGLLDGTMLVAGSMIGSGIFILRKKRPDLPRTYKAFGYPLLPALYVLAATTICVGLLIFKTSYTWPGVLIILAGIPIYYWVNRKK